MVFIAFCLIKYQNCVQDKVIQKSPSERLSTRLDNELDINLKLSIKFILYVILLPFSSSFFISTEKVIYFSAVFPRHSNFPSTSSASFLIVI